MATYNVIVEDQTIRIEADSATEAARAAAVAAAATATTQAGLATTNGAAQVALAEAQVALAEAEVTAATTQATNAAASAALANQVVTQGITYAGSLHFLNDNGERPQSASNGLLELETPNSLFQNVSAGDDRMFASGSGDAWCCVVKLPVEKHMTMRRRPAIWGTGSNSDNWSANDWGVSWFTAVNSGNDRRFCFAVNQAGAGGSAKLFTDQYPEDFSGYGFLQMYEDAGNLHLEFTDWVTGDKTSGSGALSVGFLGKQTSPRLSIGGLNAAAFPVDMNTLAANGYILQDASMRDFAFLDRKLTDAEIVELRDGTPFTDIVPANERRLYAPLASNGAIDLTITGRMPTLPGALTKLGNVGNGGTLVGQSAAKRLRLKQYDGPVRVVQEFGATNARWVVPIVSETGLTGPKEVRITSEGRILVDWHVVRQVTGVETGLEIFLPDHDEAMEVWVRSAGDPDIIAVIPQVFSCWHWVVWGQSEMVHVFIFLSAIAGTYATTWTTNTGANVIDTANPQRGLKNVFLQRRNTHNATNTLYGCVYSEQSTAQYSPAAVQFAKAVRQYTNKPLVISACMVSGTGMAAWMDDDNAGRSGAIDVALCGRVANRNALGEIPVTVNIQGAWEASDIGAANFQTNLYPAWLHGQATSFVPAPDRYIYDGNLSRSAAWAMVPCARFGTGAVKVADTASMGEVRENQRASATFFGGFLGPDPTPMRFENNGLAGHHPNQNDPQGDHFLARCVAEAGLRAHGLGTYRGPVQFAEYEFVTGSGNTQVLLTLDTQIPGSIDTVDGTGAVVGFEATLTTAGGRSRANITSASIVNGRQILVTLASAATPAEFAIWFHPGGGGDYGNAAINEAWVQGCPLFNGWPIVGSNTAIPAAV